MLLIEIVEFQLGLKSLSSFRLLWTQTIEVGLRAQNETKIPVFLAANLAKQSKLAKFVEVIENKIN